LRTYLGTPTPTSTPVPSKAFQCPAYMLAAPAAPPGAERVAIIVNRDIDPGPGLMVRPFGYPQRGGNPRREPLKTSQLDTYGSRSENYALRDADKFDSPSENNPWYGQLPERPAHGHSRNYLFFDWHVGSVRAR